MRRITSAVVFAVLFVLSLYHGAQAQSGSSGAFLVTQKFALSAAGSSPSLALTSGQSVCSVTIESSTSFTGLTMFAYVSSDGPYSPSTWAVPSTFGAITSTGTTVGNIASSGITNFRVTITGLSTGTVTGVIACSTATGGGSGVTITNSPAPTYTPGATNNGANAGQSVMSYGQAWNKSTSHFDSTYLDPSEALEVTQGGTHAFRLTSASATACTSIATGAGRLVRIWNTGPVTTIFPQFYDEGASPSCAAADLLYGDGAAVTIPSGSTTVLNFEGPLTNGLSYKLSGALSATQTLVITTYGLGY